MASVVVTMDSREAKLFTAMDKLIKKQAQVNDKMKAGGRASEEAGRRSKAGFDKSTISLNSMNASITKYVAGIGLAATAIGAVRKAWDSVNEAGAAGLSQLQRTSEADRRLLQISDKEEFTQRRNLADKLAGQFGVDRAVVRDVIFSGVSEGFEDAVPKIIAANQAVDPLAAAGVAGQVPALFGGAIGAIESIDATLTASGGSRLDFEKLAKALPQGAEGGGIAKATAKEVLGMLGVMASQFKSGDVAADRFKILATRFGLDEQFAGRGVLGPLEELMGMSEADRKKFLGDSQELNAAYVKTSEHIALMKTRIDEITAGMAAFNAGGGLLNEKINIANNDAQLSAVRNEMAARQRLETAQANINGEFGGSSAQAAMMAQQRIVEDGSFGAKMLSFLVGEQVAKASVMGGFSPERAGEIGADAAGRFGNLIPGVGAYEFFSDVKEAAQAMFKSSENMNQAADKISRSNVGAARAQAAGAGN